MDNIRTALKAMQWQKIKGEMRAFEALAGSYPNDGSLRPEESATWIKWQKIKAEVNWFVDHFEKLGLHE